MSKLAILLTSRYVISSQSIFRRSHLWIGGISLILLTLLVFGVPIVAGEPDLSQEQFDSKFSKLKAEMRQVWLDGESRRLAVLEAREAAHDSYATDAAHLEAFKLIVGKGMVLTAQGIELARPRAAEPIAFDVLEWILLNLPIGASADYAVDLIIKHHLRHERTAKLIDELADENYPCIEPLSRVLATTGHEAATKALATFNLGKYFCHRAELADRIIDERGTARERFGLLLGEPFLSDLHKSGSPALYEESLRHFEAARKLFGTEKISGVAVSELAASYIDQIENVSIGKMAPDSTGEDLDGQKFALSRYRGKVVVLVFWATWCRPCMREVPYERSLVARMEGKPFVLIGVNGDTERTAAKEAITRQNMSWRSFVNGGPKGPLSRQWHQKSWPTCYVIDHKGVIRAKNLSRMALDEKVDALVSEAQVAANVR
jgi:peroxiredoxin